MQATTEATTPAEQALVDEARRAGHPYVLVRDGDGALAAHALAPGHGTYTVGRRPEADIALTWDREVSRLHAQLDRLAGEWTIVDDGLSQNGTFVNETRLAGRRRLVDGDTLRVGRTTLAFHDPSPAGPGMTLLPGELTAATALSEQQHQVLRELCRPLAREGEGAAASTDEQIAAATGIPLDAVETEMAGLLAAFGVDDVPPAVARHELAVAALGSGLVSFE